VAIKEYYVCASIYRNVEATLVATIIVQVSGDIVVVVEVGGEMNAGDGFGGGETEGEK
jgi:hypothetical protein